jgi:pyruvate/2-oxoglutarate dehydrogenase complex dihydrolipoamide acyltransferase (E2) component
VKLGFMSAFVRAAAEALKEVPAVNAVIDGDEIVYRCVVIRGSEILCTEHVRKQ